MSARHVNYPEDLDDGRARIAVAAGVLAALAFTGVAVVLPLVIPFDDVRRHLYELTGRWFWNLQGPVDFLRFFGGFVGGLAAGFLTLNTAQNGAIRGGLAGLVAIFVIYFAVVGVGITDWIINVGGMPPLAPIVVVPFVLWIIQFGAPFVIGGLVGGFIGAWWRVT